MVDFVETPRFPDAIAYGSSFGPGYSTSIASNIGGDEASNANRSMPLYRGDVVHGVKTQVQLDDLLAFFLHVDGKHKRFRFKNFNDFTVAGAQGILVAITANTTWQMWKRYTFGSITKDRIIQKPVSSTTIVVGTGAYSVDYTTGIVTRNSGANPTGYTSQHDFPVRFDTDEMLPSMETLDAFTWGPIPIKEVRI